jgi:hypothetical protein
MAQLYLDLDGVLLDFDALATRVLGMPPGKFEDKYGSKLFWKKLQDFPDFYFHLDLMSDTEKLYLNTLSCKPVILTGLPKGGWATDQKERSVAKHFPGTPLITCMARHKCDYCKPGDVLIDDRPKYKSYWEDKGGIFIVHTSADSSLKQLGPYMSSLIKT